jgi:hypothetical protein
LPRAAAKVAAEDAQRRERPGDGRVVADGADVVHDEAVADAVGVGGRRQDDDEHQAEAAPAPRRHGVTHSARRILARSVGFRGDSDHRSDDRGRQ